MAVWPGPGAPHVFEQNFISCGHKQSEAGRGAGHGASWAGDKPGKVEIRKSDVLQKLVLKKGPSEGS